jgi:hypothetical protein
MGVALRAWRSPGAHGVDEGFGGGRGKRKGKARGKRKGKAVGEMKMELR